MSKARVRKLHPAFIERKFRNHYVIASTANQDRGFSTVVWPGVTDEEHNQIFGQSLKWTIAPVTLMRDLDGKEYLDYYISDTDGSRYKLSSLAGTIQTLVETVTQEVTTTELLVGEGYIACLGNLDLSMDKVFTLMKNSGAFNAYANWERRLLNPTKRKAYMAMTILWDLERGLDVTLRNLPGIVKNALDVESETPGAGLEDIVSSIQFLKDKGVDQAVFDHLEIIRKGLEDRTGVLYEWGCRT